MVRQIDTSLQSYPGQPRVLMRTLGLLSRYNWTARFSLLKITFPYLRNLGSLHGRCPSILAASGGHNGPPQYLPLNFCTLQMILEVGAHPNTTRLLLGPALSPPSHFTKWPARCLGSSEVQRLCTSPVVASSCPPLNLKIEYRVIMMSSH